jgi:uncharacterized protein YecT (DUF1311 family)
VAAIAVAGGVRERNRERAAAAAPVAARSAPPSDSVTRVASAGELDSPAVSTPPTDAARTTAAASRRAPAAPSSSSAPAASPSRTTLPRARGSGAAAPVGARPGPRVAFARTHEDSLRLCSSAASADQSACLTAALSEHDRGLNNVYRTVIGEMRRQSDVPTGAPDPPAVARLRAEQRAWLVERDEACRRQGGGREGALWAASRARCLGVEATRRAAVLADRLTNLRAP